MKRFATIFALALAAAVCTSDSASAQHPCGFGGFQPFGFYQPYGARYGASLATPPYFALNPPVYYGSRYSRPYGISPFASPPLIGAPSGYEGRLRSGFQQTPSGRRSTTMHANPYISHRVIKTQPVAKMGAVQTNPFATNAAQLAKN